MPPDVVRHAEAFPKVVDVAQPLGRLFEDLFLRGHPVDPSYSWQPLAERVTADDTHHFYGAWPGARLRGLARSADTYASRVAGVHAPYLDSIIAGVPVSTQPTVYMTGGGTASGKSRALLNNPEVGIPARGKAAYVDPDAAKALMPEYQQAVQRGDQSAASDAHTESSFMAKMGITYALAHQRDVVYDSVGDSGIEALTRKVEGMRADGATRVFGDYATVSVAEALKRSEKRALATGRWVPEAFIRASHGDVSRTWRDAALSGVFDRLRLWDNNGPQPILIASATGGQLTIFDQPRWDAFSQIGGGIDG